MILNTNVKLKNGGRKAMKLTLPEFKKKYIDYLLSRPEKDLEYIFENLEEDENGNFVELTDKEGLRKILNSLDLNKLPLPMFDRSQKYKVRFDMENYELEKIGRTVRGVPYLAAWYGGDWETPIFVFYYFDNHGKLMNYIPTKGNSYNVETMTAIGSEYDSDKFVDLCKKYGIDTGEGYYADGEQLSLAIINKREGTNITYEEWDPCMYDSDFDMCLEDFTARVHPEF